MAALTSFYNLISMGKEKKLSVILELWDLSSCLYFGVVLGYIGTDWAFCSFYAWRRWVALWLVYCIIRSKASVCGGDGYSTWQMLGWKVRKWPLSCAVEPKELPAFFPTKPRINNPRLFFLYVRARSTNTKFDPQGQAVKHPSPHWHQNDDYTFGGRSKTSQTKNNTT